MRYQFADTSYHKGLLEPQLFADQGHRLIIPKASDGYHMPDENGKYDLAAERHHDVTFAPMFIASRNTGLIAGGYHFARFNMPWRAPRAVIIDKNLEYYLEALDHLPGKYREDASSVGFLDIEQDSQQLKDAGLSRGDVSKMAIEIGRQFVEVFDIVVLYSGSWWTDEWFNDTACKWFADNCAVWEPEYIPIGIKSYPTLRYKNYLPSVPKFFSNEFATSAEDVVGKLFAHQYTEAGRIPGIRSNLDLNLTELTKEELSKLFGQTIGFVPPFDKKYYRRKRAWPAHVFRRYDINVATLK